MPRRNSAGLGWVRFSSSRVSAGFGTLQSRLPWFHRAGPSTTLDKGYSVDNFIIAHCVAVSIAQTEKSAKNHRYPFGLGLKMNATTTPRKMAAAMPPAVLVTPPVTAPRRPFSATASFTPFARL